MEIVGLLHHGSGLSSDGGSYAVYIGILSFYLVFAYFMYPETKGRTIEEVSVIFDLGRKGSPGSGDEELAGGTSQQDGERDSTAGEGEKAEVMQDEVKVSRS